MITRFFQRPQLTSRLHIYGPCIYGKARKKIPEASNVIDFLVVSIKQIAWEPENRHYSVFPVLIFSDKIFSQCASILLGTIKKGPLKQVSNIETLIFLRLYRAKNKSRNYSKFFKYSLLFVAPNMINR